MIAGDGRKQSMTRVPIWTGLDPVPGAWEVWRDECDGFAITRSQGTNMFSGMHHTAVAIVTVGYLYKLSVTKRHIKRVVFNRSQSVL